MEKYAKAARLAAASSLSVSVNGKTTATGVKCPARVLDSEDAGMSYSTFTVSGGETVTVIIKSENNGSQNNAWLNAFEIDGADPFNSISGMLPRDQEKHQRPADGLSWKAGNGAQSHDVYIGTDFSYLAGTAAFLLFRFFNYINSVIRLKIIRKGPCNIIYVVI